MTARLGCGRVQPSRCLPAASGYKYLWMCGSDCLRPPLLAEWAPFHPAGLAWGALPVSKDFVR
jgi:hypothetical protein